MRKFNLGTVTNSRTGETENVEVEYPKDQTIGDLLVGAGLIVAGLTYHYFMKSAYRSGALEALENEHKVLDKIGVLEED